MPIPRRFDRRPPERDQTRVNERIRVPEVRLIGEDGSQIGVVPTPEALTYAQDRDLDLVEVAAEARPPVVRVLDYSKYKYEQEQKAKAARKHQKQVTVREIKLRPKIAKNDYETKKGHVVRFLKHQDRVKITIMFRGRETTHPERGENLLMRLAEDVAELGVIEQRPNLDGRNMTMLLAPVKPKEEGAETPAAAEQQAAPAAEEEQAEPLPAIEHQPPARVAEAEEDEPEATEEPAEEEEPEATEEPAGEEQPEPAEEPATEQQTEPPPAAEGPAAA